MGALRYMALAAAPVWGASACVAADWPHWRGPHYNGSAEESGLPATWSKQQNVRWATPLPGRSAATPAVWQDRVFITSLTDGGREVIAMCLAADDGKVLWTRPMGPNRVLGNNTSASISPVTDGQHVIFLLGNGDLFAFDMDGRELWRKHVHSAGDLSIQFGYASSPLLLDGRVYVQVIQNSRQIYRGRNNSNAETPPFLLCLEAASGREIWRHVRRTDASSESQESYSSPLPFVSSNGMQILVAGADYLTGHDPADGREVWRWGSFNQRKARNWRLVSTPLLVGELLVFCPPRGLPAYALKAGQSGGPSDVPPLWNLDSVRVDVCTPLFYQGLVYFLDGDKRIFTCVDPATGQIHYSENIATPGQSIFRASPTASDGKIYCISEDGGVIVLKAGPQYEVMSRIAMGEGLCQSSIAIANKRLYLRTAQNLYCIESAAE